MRMLKLAAVDLDYRAGIPKQNLRGGFHDARLSRPGGTEVQKTAYRAPWRVQTGTEELVQVHHRLHRFLLPHDLGANASSTSIAGELRRAESEINGCVHMAPSYRTPLL